MEPYVLVHIILGSILTLAIIVTLYFLVRLLLAPKDKKTSYKPLFRKSLISTVALYTGYMIMIWSKNTFF
ncbi:4-hydroxybenzoate polyprenyltransferase [Evansella vedderi]|uniref:4-hydroxybenzoate polyprenyltransferase n=1 Tax=Evansella vedderi TaxID=38282 RepID=A0ABT9ZWN4_9BACI|nr:hypothetical protein [Evansella vedderi]MDQ0255279.1 4-hydroxybenzoate polyprenyltransferase [Evansella vedderi]